MSTMQSKGRPEVGVDNEPDAVIDRLAGLLPEGAWTTRSRAWRPRS